MSSPMRVDVEVARWVLVSAAGVVVVVALARVRNVVDVVMSACVRIMNTVLPTHARAKSLSESGRPLH